MKSPKTLDPPPGNRPSTTKEELKLVCKKIADMDALWRTHDSGESPVLKRAA